MLDDQKEQLTKVAEAARANRGGPGAGGQGGGERPNFQDMSDEERQEFMAEMRERAEKAEKEARAKLAEILLPHQMERLEQLSLQQRGVAALMDPAIQTKLNITEEQKGKLQKAQEETSAKMRELFQGAGGGGGGAGGNREEIMKKMTELRKASEGGVLAVLTAEQTKAFEEMKGKAFEFSPPQGRFGPGGNRPRPNNDQ
ncbi:MAG: hypothetical protein FJ297_08385 [Planctomycetes bacterium]|nr:hypothetical protein [Planctomycetota bacterium]